MRRNRNSDIPFAWYWKGKSLRKGDPLGNIIGPVHVCSCVLEENRPFSSPYSHSWTSLWLDNCVSESNSGGSSYHGTCSHCNHRDTGGSEQHWVEAPRGSHVPARGARHSQRRPVSESSREQYTADLLHISGHRSGFVIPDRHFHALDADDETILRSYSSRRDPSQRFAARQLENGGDETTIMGFHSPSDGPLRSPALRQLRYGGENPRTIRPNQGHDEWVVASPCPSSASTHVSSYSRTYPSSFASTGLSSSANICSSSYSSTCPSFSASTRLSSSASTRLSSIPARPFHPRAPSLNSYSHDDEEEIEEHTTSDFFTAEEGLSRRNSEVYLDAIAYQ